MLALLTAVLILAPPPRPEYGLLVGTSNRSAFDMGGRQQFTTYWIRIGKDVTLAATLTDLVLPRNDHEFLRIAMRRECELSADGGDHDECRDTLWTAPFASSDSGPHHSFPANTSPDDPCCYEKLVVKYATQGLLSMERWIGDSVDCDPLGRTSVEAFVRQVASARELSVGEVVGPKGTSAYVAAAQRARDVSSDDTPEESDVVLPETDVVAQNLYASLCRADRQATTRWEISRRNGAWRPALYQKLGCQCELWAPIKAHLPRRLTGADSLPVPLEQLQKDSLPDDVFASPDGRVMLADYNSSLQIRPYEAGALGDALLTLPEGRVVMLRWATGAQIRRWDLVLRQMARVREKGRRTPVRPPTVK